jgi:hypothetical protein
MSVPSIPELELAAKKIVWTAKKEGNLKFSHFCQSSQRHFIVITAMIGALHPGWSG